MIKNKRYEELDKLFNTPVIFSYDDESLKIKKTLLVISCIGFFSSLYGISISADSSLFGIKFNNITQALLIKVLLFFNIYYLFKFCWVSIEYFWQWKIRVTGSGQNSVYKGGWGTELVDLHNDPKQSSLYNWWLKHAKYFRENDIDLINKMDEVRKIVSKDDWSTSSGRITELIQEIDENLRNIKSVLGDGRIETSLKRFDRSFFLFITLQNFRWIVLDFLMPICVGLASVISLYLYKEINFGLLLLWV